MPPTRPQPALDRRALLRTGALALGAAPLPAALRLGAPRELNCIFLRQGGGMSHLDTVDMKPNRSPFRQIATSVPGIRVCEHLPRIAKIMDKVTILRSLTAEETNHERAQQALIALPAASHRIQASVPDAIDLIASGVRHVTISGGDLTWDCHGNLFDTYRRSVLPAFDQQFAGLVNALCGRGLLSTTLVIALGEFGRTPAINEGAGRDHHSRAWSALFAGGGMTGGRILGATDSNGGEVTSLPVTPADLLATLAGPLGLAQPGKGVSIPGFFS